MAQRQPVSSSTRLDSMLVDSLRTAMRGPVLTPDDTGYEAACELWNGMIVKRPALIARCSGTADVVAAVKFARENNLLAAVRGGGHNASGNALCDGGIVIDLTTMRGVFVDPRRQTARAQGGATWADFDRETALHGLATTGGAISTTGIGGLTLGGGLGFLMRRFGLACDNLISAEVVTADGEVVTASENENADLFWGLRGGGGNFGVVTSLEYRLHRVPQVVGGMILHPYERARDVLQFAREFTASAPETVCVFTGLMTGPDGQKVAGYVVNYSGDIEDADATLRPLLEFGQPIMTQIGPMPYDAQQQMLDAVYPAGLQVYWRSDFLNGLSDEAIDTLLAHFDGVTSPLSQVLVEHLGGAVARVDPASTAFAHRNAEYNLAIISRWEDPAGADAHIAWTRALHDAIKPYTSGVYVNYLSVEGEERVKAAYGEEKYARLVELKNKYDPTNFFRLNQNIRPSV